MKKIGIVGGSAWPSRRSSKQEFTAPLVMCLACTEVPLAFSEAGTLAVFEFGHHVHQHNCRTHPRNL